MGNKVKTHTGLKLTNIAVEYTPLVEAHTEKTKAHLLQSLGLPLMDLKHGMGVEFQFRGNMILLSVHSRKLIMWRRRTNEQD